MNERLEKEIDKYLSECLALKFPTTDKKLIKKLITDDIKYVARHFAKWGAEHRDGALSCSQPSDDFKEFEKSYIEQEEGSIICLYDRLAGLIDGANWQRQQYENGKVHYPSCKSGYFDGRGDEKKQMKKKAISGSVHHALNTHYLVIDQPQLNAILKEFDQDEKAKVIILHDNE